jgi:hypothetical protein
MTFEGFFQFSTATKSYHWTRILVLIFFWIQTFEYHSLKSLWFGKTSVWNQKILQNDFELFPSWIRKILELLMSQDHFLSLFLLRYLFGLLGFFWISPWVDGFLFFSTWMFGFRWRGTFNGGSDFMGLILTGTLFVLSFAPSNPTLLRAGLAYIAVQSITSYFIAGLVKVKNQSWRTGTALRDFFLAPPLQAPAWIHPWIQNNFFIHTLSWTILLFELSFPFVFLFPGLKIYFILTAFTFHLGNFYFFRLNRFVWAWLATYPSILYLLPG